jgi:hypothetical protein
VTEDRIFPSVATWISQSRDLKLATLCFPKQQFLLLTYNLLREIYSFHMVSLDISQLLVSKSCNIITAHQAGHNIYDREIVTGTLQRPTQRFKMNL